MTGARPSGTPVLVRALLLGAAGVVASLWALGRTGDRAREKAAQHGSRRTLGNAEPPQIVASARQNTTSIPTSPCTSFGSVGVSQLTSRRMLGNAEPPQIVASARRNTTSIPTSPCTSFGSVRVSQHGSTADGGEVGTPPVEWVDAPDLEPVP